MTKVVFIREHDSLLTIARTHKVGIEALTKANGLTLKKGEGMLAFEFAYLGDNLRNGLRAGDIVKFTYRVSDQGFPVFVKPGTVNRYYVFPSGIPDGQAVEVSSPFQDGAEVFTVSNDWFTVSPWLQGQELIIPETERA